jgi:hypothetical protein
LTCNATRKDEGIEVFYWREDFVVLTRRFVWVIGRDGKELKSCSEIGNITKIRPNKSVLVAELVTGSYVTLECRTPEEAKDLFVRLKSKAFLGKVLQ